MWRPIIIFIAVIIAVILALTLYEPAEAPEAPDTGTGALLEVEVQD